MYPSSIFAWHSGTRNTGIHPYFRANNERSGCNSLFQRLASYHLIVRAFTDFTACTEFFDCDIGSITQKGNAIAQSFVSVNHFFHVYL